MKNQTTTRRLADGDRERIRCQGGRFGDPGCENPADVSETVNWNTGNTKGISFFYFCDPCYAKQQAGLVALTFGDH